MLLLVTVLALYASFYHKRIKSEKDSEVFWQYHYYETLADITSIFIEIYVDLFLLWLLYRFMRPQNILDSQSLEISALLFVHDS